MPGRASHALLATTAAIVLVLGVSACAGDIDSAFEDPPRPARTGPPARTGEAWLGPRHGGLRFYGVQRDRRQVLVNYGEPTPPDPGSGDWWHFPLTVSTAPRRPQTRGRLQRSLGEGVAVRLGTRFGCRAAARPRRIAVLTRTVRIEVNGLSCAGLRRAARALRLG